MELVERVVRWASEPPREQRLANARAAFEQRTAPIEIDQRDYEARIGHFLDWFVCDYAEDGEVPPVQAFAAAHTQLPERDRGVLAGLLRSHRTLLEVVCAQPTVELRDLASGASFVLASPPEQLSRGDIFDGRVLWDGSAVALAQGRVYHPADTHAPLRAMLQDTRALALPRARLLDGLLAMRDRLQRFTRVRAEHLYTADALGSEAFSATWKRGDIANGAPSGAPRSKGP